MRQNPDEDAKQKERQKRKEFWGRIREGQSVEEESDEQILGVREDMPFEDYPVTFSKGTFSLSELKYKKTKDMIQRAWQANLMKGNK